MTLLESTDTTAISPGGAMAAEVSAEDAWQRVFRRLPEARRGQVHLVHHPFTGVCFEVTGRRGRSLGHAYALVDQRTGKAYLTDPWPELGPPPQDARPTEPAHAGASVANAVGVARRTIATGLVRKWRLGRSFVLRPVEVVTQVWKPNWIVEAHLGTDVITVIVDGLDGSHYVVGASPRAAAADPTG